MSWEDYVRSRLVLPPGRRRHEDEIVAELSAQLEDVYRRALERGAAEERARSEALEYVGDWEALVHRVAGGERPSLRPILEAGFDRTEQYLRSRGRLGGACADFGWDLRFTLRTFRRTPVMVALIVFTLGLGIGANTAIFSLLNVVLLRPLPYDQPNELVEVNHRYLERGDIAGVSVPTWHDLSTASRSFEKVAICDRWIPTLSGSGEPALAVGALISPGFFETFGASPRSGRLFQPDDYEPETERTVIISHELWRQRFAGDPAALGRTLAIDGVSFLIVGIMPPDFIEFFETGREFWVPMILRAEDFAPERRIWGRYRLVARLSPGVTPEMAAEEMSNLAEAVKESEPGVFPEEWTLSVTTLSDRLRDPFRTTLLILFAAAIFVLLLICANLAGLLLARALERCREIAIRRALGAGRRRLLRQFLTEGLVLSLLGGLAGVVVAVGCFTVIRRIAPGTLVQAVSEIGCETLAVALIISLLVSVVFGLTPFLQLTGEKITRTLNEGGLASHSSRPQARYRNILVSMEFAITLILLIGAGLMIQSLGQLRRIDSGFEIPDLLAVHLRFPPSTYPDAHTQISFLDRLLPAMQSLSGVEAVATTSIIPFTGEQYTTLFRCEGAGYPGQEGRDWDSLPQGELRIVSPEFSQTMDFPVLRGRFFESADNLDSLPVAVVDDVLARQCWPDEDPIGKRITLSDANDPEAVWFTIVGVVPNLQYITLDAERRGQFYLPFRQVAGSDIGLIIRTRTAPAILAPALRNAIASIDPRLPLSNIVTIKQLLARSLGSHRLLMMLLTVFGGFSLFLASVGVYAVMTYLVRARSREMGVRRALGAGRGNLLALIVREGLLLVVIGLGCGLLGSAVLVRFLRGHLYGVSPFDPLTFLVVSGLLLITAVIALSLPAKRVMQVDPAVNLRRE